MDILEVLDQVREQLQQKGRLSYRILKRQFALDDEALDDLKFELIDIQEVATDKDGKMLVWTGGETPEETASQTADALAVEPPASSPPAQPEPETPAGERRQLTVMFCDLVGSTALSEQLDLEELQTVVRTYQEVSAQVIERYEGYIAQYLGDGLLVYFGYPVAHEDDAARAIYAGLEIVTALGQARSQFPQLVQVRIGIHTGPVVVGQMGGGSRHEQLALGETPNIAARVQGKAQPDEVVISAATQRLAVGLFETEDRGQYELKGVSTPQPLYRVTAQSLAHSRFEVTVRTGLTPLVGREHELGVFTERWLQAQAGSGQAVLVSGEPGMGKSRLVQELKERVASEGTTWITFQCSPYHQNSALYPVTEHLQRLLQFAPDDTPETKLDKLQQTLGRYHFPQATTVPLLAALLSLPPPAGVPLLTVSPQKQKELTQQTLVQWLVEEAEQTPVVCTWEDLHWADPSTLELLTLCLDQLPTARMLAVLVFRPEFTPPWGTRSYLSQLTLSRLDRSQVERLVERVIGGRVLPVEVVQQVAEKTDGVPLFVEELTKTILESGVVRAVNSHYELTGPLSSFVIPSTLHDSLMARLDRLTTAKAVAQLGATLGREFSYEVLRAVSPLDEEGLQDNLKQLVINELMYQRGLPPQAHYLFKHALIQDTAYQSLLKSTRQQLHQQIAQVLEERFSETVELQPELVAHHYTQAGRIAQALPYWQQAGQRAAQRSASAEAIGHLSKALELLKTLPDISERSQQELTLHLALGTALTATKGWSAAEVGEAYTRAHELCQRTEDALQLFSVLRGLGAHYLARADFATARQYEEQLLSLAQRVQDQALLVTAHRVCGETLLWLGDYPAAQEHLERGVALYDPDKHNPFVTGAAQDPGVACLYALGGVLSDMGYPDQGLKRSQEAVALARELSHPYSLATALLWAGEVHLLRLEGRTAQTHYDEVLALATELGFAYWKVVASQWKSRALVLQDRPDEAFTLLEESMPAWQAIGGVQVGLHSSLGVQTEIYGKAGQIDKALSRLDEAFAVVEKTGQHRAEPWLYLLKGELTLQSGVQSPESRVQKEAEACLQQARDVARQQHAKLYELRATTSLARLWQQQGKKKQAHTMLSEIYSWFTEGFDTADLKEAKALLVELSAGK